MTRGELAEALEESGRALVSAALLLRLGEDERALALMDGAVTRVHLEFFLDGVLGRG